MAKNGNRDAGDHRHERGFPANQVGLILGRVFQCTHRQHG